MEFDVARIKKFSVFQATMTTSITQKNQARKQKIFWILILVGLHPGLVNRTEDSRSKGLVLESLSARY